MRKVACILVVLCGMPVWAQQTDTARPDKAPDQKAVDQSTSDQKAAEQKASDHADASGQKNGAADHKLVESEPNTLMSEERIPSGARVYIAPMANGFDNYVIAGIQKKKVPVVVVADRSKAEFEVTGIADTDKAGWAKMLFLGSQQTNESASVKMVNLKSGAVVFAYSVNKTNSIRGKQSAGEACAKHMKAKIVD
jgi:hypothetical protein